MKNLTLKTIKQFSLLFLISIAFTACSSDDDNTNNPEPVNEEEVITTLTATLIPVGGGTTVTMQTRDLDGDGPNAPVITVSSDLVANTVYNGSLVLLNETESPAGEINEEIVEESIM